MLRKRWALIALLVVIINAPILIIALGIGDHYLGSFLVGGVDYPTYLTKMKIGYEGGWQYFNRYTSEPHEPTFIFMFYILLGHIARILSLSLHFTFHAARFILAFISLNILYKFIEKYTDTENKPLVFLLAVFIAALPVNGFNMSQLNLYLGVMGYTHYMVTLPALLIYFDSVFEYSRTRSLIYITKSCIAILILTSIHPFMFALAGLIAGGTALLSRSFKEAFPALLASGVVVGPVMSYFLHIFTNNAVLVGWRNQTVIEIGLLKHLFIFGIASVYTYILFGLVVVRKVSFTSRSLIFPVWFIIAMFLSFTNLISSKPEWLFFANIPLAVMSAKLIQYVKDKQTFKVQLFGKPVVIGMLVLILIGYALSSVTRTNIGAVKTLVKREEHCWDIVSPGDKKCLDWFGYNAAKEQIIAAPPEIGNLIPYFTNSISYCGHPVETLFFAEKVQKLECLLGGLYSDNEAQDFFKINRISYLVVSKAGLELKYPCLVAVAEGDNLRVYRVEV